MKQTKNNAMTYSLFGCLSLSWLIGFVLLGGLIYFGGIWNLLANTRILDLLIEGGIIQYTDVNAGFIKGVGQHTDYLKSQDPISWSLVLLVIGLFVLFWAIKALQFHHILGYHGVKGSLRQHARAYLYGLSYKKLMPFKIGDTATVAALKAEGVELNRAYSAVFLFNLFILFNIVFFALIGLFVIGWSTWLVQILVALVIFSITYFWVRRAKSEPNPYNTLSFWAATNIHFNALLQKPLRFFTLALLSIITFLIEDIAAYLLAMAFSGKYVILHIDFSLLLMGMVGGYITRLIRVTPGGIGQFELGFAVILYLGGLGLPEAVTIAILYSVFRYITLGFVYLIVWAISSVKNYSSLVQQLIHEPLPKELSPSTSQTIDALNPIPAVPVPQIPQTFWLWNRFIVILGVFAAIFLFDQFTILLANYWLLESLNLSKVFWTNFNMGATLFIIALFAFLVAVILPAYVHSISSQARWFVIKVGIQVAVPAALFLSLEYLEFLVFTGNDFGQTDPVFHHDLSFYIFTLSPLWTVLETVLLFFIVLSISSIGCAYAAAHSDYEKVTENRLLAGLAFIATPLTLISLAGIGIISAIAVWLSRYDLLWKDNNKSAIYTGAEYLDITGLFSSLNYLYVSSLSIIILTFVLIIWLNRIYKTVKNGNFVRWQAYKNTGYMITILIAVNFIFAGMVSLRDLTVVKPNEPVIQMKYIQRHLEATRAAYQLENIKLIDFTPNGVNDPLPNAEELLASPTLKNAPLWPTYVNYLEPLLDPQHSRRILQTKGDNMVYGPTLESFRQQQKLRTYYNILDVDPLRFKINGETQVFASAVRELPLLEPQPWLTWWGQRYLLYTHGHGLIMAPIGQKSSEGMPVFVSKDIPSKTDIPELAVDNQEIYYGEGSVTMAFSNIKGLKEFDYPTEQGRAENIMTEVGVPMDSLLKRIVLGWRSNKFFELVFSDLITPDTYVHYIRTPLERIKTIAPFLYLDTNPYAAPVDGDIQWVVNGMTVSDKYPYSKHEILGNKAVSRSFKEVDMERVNYIEDSVKITLNAKTGQMKFYKMKQDPIINTWAGIYPDLFMDQKTMPANLRQQLTYPLQLFHIIFDDLFIIYHMNDPVYFFNMEDQWDDGDEVLGPILDSGNAINFSIEPYPLLLETKGILPASKLGTQFSLMGVFTPERALNLRAIPIAYQDGEDYGRLMVLQIPKGHYVLGPEQADAMIDQDPIISEKLGLWNRQGNEVIRGHTSLLVIGNEVLYIEPIFTRSKQNPNTQLKRVIVVFRGKPYMAKTLKEAIHLALTQPDKAN